MLNEEDRRKRRRIWFSGSLALLVLAAAGAGWAVLRISGDIAARTVSALQTSGLDPRAAVSVEGRTVTLSGEVPNTYTRARMRAIAGSIRGVRTVIDQLSVAALPPAEDASPPEVRLLTVWTLPRPACGRLATGSGIAPATAAELVSAMMCIALIY